MNSLNLKFQFDCIPRESQTPGYNAIAELNNARALCELAHPFRSRHKCRSLLVAFIASVALTPNLSFAQCAFVSGNWIASTQAGKRLTLHIEQSRNSCHLMGGLYFEDWRGVINGGVSGNEISMSVTSDGSTWYLKGSARQDSIVFVKWKDDPPQWHLYATFRRLIPTN